MRINKRKIYQNVAAALTALTLAQAALFPAMAAEPKVTVDETMYVNLDAYGRKTAVNVVKGVGTNGVKSFTDYGEYTDVINMSGHTQPQQEKGKVTWDLSQSGNRFYYQGTMDKEKVELPWNFDVTYKLNGRETKAEELAGASGLIEIHVKAEPNEKADLYYRNNMMLSVLIPADLSKCYSVDAPGSQTQTIGEMTGVVFTALPGEEGDFTARIGTDSFESIGVVMMMIPGTTSSLQHVKDIKEMKDTWRQAGSDLYDSCDAMAASMEAMRDGVLTVQDSLNELEDARRTVSGSRAAIENQNDASIAALSALAQQSAVMVPYLQTAKENAQVLNENMNGLVSTLTELQEPLENLDENLDTVQNGLSRTKNQLPALEQSLMQVISLDTQLQAQQATILMTLVGLSETSMEGDIDQDAEEYADDQAIAYADAMMAASGLNPDDPAQKELYEQQRDAIYQQAYKKYLNGYKDQALGQLHSATSGIESPKDALMGKVDALQVLASNSNALSRSAQTMLNGLDHATDDMRDLMAYSDSLIDDVYELQNTMNQYYPALQDGLTDSQELLNRTNNLLNQTVASMTIIQNTLKSSGGNLDEGTRKMLQGSTELLDKSLAMLDATGEIRKSSGVMKTTLDKELDKFEDENRFLEMDPDAPMVSFTSSKNQEPDSLQIIVRTDEISLDEEGNGVMDAETEPVPVNPFQRMWNVLVKMWQAVAQVFRDR